MVVITLAPLREPKLRPMNRKTDCVSQPEAHMNVQPLILQPWPRMQLGWRRPRCTHIFRAAPCRMYREAICHAQIQRTQKAEKDCTTTTAASNATTAPAVIAAATTAAT